MTGTYRIPETIHQINTTSNRESYLFKEIGRSPDL